jgi:hypothetical protein
MTALTSIIPGIAYVGNYDCAVRVVYYTRRIDARQLLLWIAYDMTPFLAVRVLKTWS